MNILWTATSKNIKTGNIPTAWAGKDKTEARESCKGCKLLGNGCYAWAGSPSFVHVLINKVINRGEERSLEYALRNRSKTAKSVRLTGIGDIGRCGKKQADEIVAKIKQEGLGILGYTHHWREKIVEKAWKGRLMASCESESDADFAVSKGWRATMIVNQDSPKSFKTAGGNRVTVCPAQLRENEINCNDCRLCDASRDIVPIVAFMVHGNGKNKITKKGHLAK